MFWRMATDGSPIREPDVTAWAKWYSAADRNLATDCIGETYVSTIFTGVDSNFRRQPPLVFETMIFGGPMHRSVKRYGSMTEALAGHASAVDAARAHTG